MFLLHLCLKPHAVKCRLGGLLLAKGGAGRVTLSDFSGGGAALISNLDRNAVLNCAEVGH